MAMLIAAAAVFLAIHLLIAGTRVRDAITGAIGEGAYLGLFSLASLGAIVWLAMSYKAAKHGPDALLYDLGPGVTYLGIPVIALAFLLGVQGLFMPNPTPSKACCASRGIRFSGALQSGRRSICRPMATKRR
jgi:uncharacterized membrane protein